MCVTWFSSNLKDGDNLYDYDQTRLKPPSSARLYAPITLHSQTFERISNGTRNSQPDHPRSAGLHRRHFEPAATRLGPFLSPLLARARLRSYQRAIYEQLDQAQHLFL